jgi:hypothetical protein
MDLMLRNKGREERTGVGKRPEGLLTTCDRAAQKSPGNPGLFHASDV